MAVNRSAISISVSPLSFSQTQTQTQNVNLKIACNISHTAKTAKRMPLRPDSRPSALLPNGKQSKPATHTVTVSVYICVCLGVCKTVWLHGTHTRKSVD